MEDRPCVIAGCTIQSPQMSVLVLAWWAFLSTVTVFQCYQWYGLKPNASAEYYRVLQWRLAGVYAVVCAYRSVFPKIDLERFVLFDVLPSSIFIGRTFATIAEVVFATQCGMCLFHLTLGQSTTAVGADAAALFFSSSFPSVEAIHVVCFIVARAMPIVLFIAQLFCWSGVISLNHWGHAVEDSIWGAAYACYGACLVGLATRAPAQHLPYMLSGVAACFVFALFIFTVDVPMYLRRWREGKQRRVKYLSLTRGVKDAWARRVRTQSLKDWKEEIAWLTGYFIGGVQFSLLLITI